MASSSSCVTEVSVAGAKCFASLTSMLLVADSVHQRVTGVIVFIADNPVRPVHSNENPSLSRWYSQNSNVFVARAHSLWEKTERKMSRRYGKVQQSPGTTINEMLILHREEVFAWVAAKTGFSHNELEEVKMAEDLVMSLEKADIQNGVADSSG